MLSILYRNHCGLGQKSEASKRGKPPHLVDLGQVMQLINRVVLLEHGVRNREEARIRRH